MEQRELLSAVDLQKMGMSRPMVYKLLNRADVPVLQIGKRKFIYRACFDEWAKAQSKPKGGA